MSAAPQRNHKSTPASGKKPGKKAAKGVAPLPAKPTPAAPDDMSPEVIEFLTAIETYKRKNARPFPSWSEVLDVVKSLGYRRPA